MKRLSMRQTGPAALALLALGLAQTGQAAEVAVCTFAGSPSQTLDRQVASAVVRAMGDEPKLVADGIGDAKPSDDGMSARQIGKQLNGHCDVVAGFPVAVQDSAPPPGMVFSRPYLRAGYVGLRAGDAGTAQPGTGAAQADGAAAQAGAGTAQAGAGTAQAGAGTAQAGAGTAQASHSAPHGDVVAVAYSSAAQLIAVQHPQAVLDLEKTQDAAVDAVATGKAVRGIVWYPAVVAYQARHANAQLHTERIVSPYADWTLVMAFAQRNAALRQRADAALQTLNANGQLRALTAGWDMPAASGHARRDGAAALAFAERHGEHWTRVALPAPNRGDGDMHAALAATNHNASFMHAVLSATDHGPGITPADLPAARHAARLIRVAATAGDDSGPPPGPSFTTAQTQHGAQLYGAQCAKCHGANLEGVNAPALMGSGFAPKTNSTLTVAGIFGYMSSNMPADKPGKLKPQEYADLLAFLLSKSGYQPGSATLTADAAAKAQMPLLSRPAH